MNGRVEPVGRPGDGGLKLALETGYNRRDEGGLSAHDNTEMVGPVNRLTAVAHTELLIDVSQVTFDGFRGDEQLVGDLLVLQALYQQFQNIELAIGQGFDHGLGGGGWAERLLSESVSLAN